MKKLIAILCLVILSACSGGENTSQGTKQLRISAASSLTNVLTEIKVLYEKDHPSTSITINYGSSGTLLHQLEQGAPTDLYFAASTNWMGEAEKKKLIVRESVREIVQNRLILASPSDSDLTIKDLSSEKVSQFSMGDPNSVPAGQYSRQVLESHGIWDEVKEKAVYGKNVRQVASYIQSNNVDVGFIYQSDLVALDHLHKIQVVKETDHNPILYPIGVVQGSKNQLEAKQFIEFLQRKEALKVFEAYGFETNK